MKRYSVYQHKSGKLRAVIWNIRNPHEIKESGEVVERLKAELDANNRTEALKMFRKIEGRQSC